MIKLNCGVSRKVGEPAFGSRGAAVNVELELESSVAQDVDLLQEKIHRLFAIARAAVDEELSVSARPANPSAPPTPPADGTNGTVPRAASSAQVRAIKAICQRLGVDVEKEVAKRCGKPVGQLSLAEASALIDQLKSLPAKGH